MFARGLSVKRLCFPHPEIWSITYCKYMLWVLDYLQRLIVVVFSKAVQLTDILI